jgi:hypothetical protein
LYVIYDLQTGTFNVSTDPPTYTVSNSKVYITSPINAEYDMDKVIIYRISSYENTDIDLNYILTQLNTFVRKQQADTITATHTFNPTQPGPAFQLGPNAQNQLIRYLNADKVDGFDVSQTPAPNVIVPLDASGILDLSSTYIRSNVYTFRRVDLTNAISDYMLQVGEEAIIWFTDTTSVPLRIATQSGTYYEMDIVVSSNVGTSGGTMAPIFLNPNNTTYSNAFSYVEIFRNDGVLGHNFFTYSAFRMGWAIGDVRAYIINFTTHKSVKGIDMQTGTSDAPVVHLYASQWNDLTTLWTSLGTITFPQGTSGYILVRRLA